MLSRTLRKQLKQFDLGSHPECSHNWIHNARMQCEWDINNIPGDSIHIANIYICTMCGGEFWSQIKEFNIPHYRVKEVRR